MIEALELRGFARSYHSKPIILARRSQLYSDTPSHYTVQQLSDLCGLDSHCVKRWLDLGLLKYEMKGTARTNRQGGDSFLIERNDVREFLHRYPELYDLRKVNQSWFIDTLREGKDERAGAVFIPRKDQPPVKTKAATLEELPEEYFCKLCGHTKPLKEMVVVFIKSEQVYRLRALCKNCHNTRERGHRREWKRDYLRRWRENNSERNTSYWKDNPKVREQSRVNAERRNMKHHDALRIQSRLKTRGVITTLQEAETLLKRFGNCYPTRFGLTKEGLRECERIRSLSRKPGAKRLTPIEIRISVYEKGMFIKPCDQPRAYQKAAQRLSELQQKRRSSPSTNAE
jgi:hypothetical protein